ncbi:hypothetical protein ABPG72_011253 [Tetrahymena utriculariae]
MKANQHFLLIGIFVLISALQFTATAKKQDISKSKNYLDSEIVDVIWCGTETQNDKNVLVQTDSGTIYRSQNKMVHFENISDNLVSAGAKYVADNSQIVESEVIRMIRSQANPNVIVLQGKNDVNWITRDCGNTFRAFSRKKDKINIFKLHPSQEAWILASTNNICTKKQKVPCFSFAILWLSKDLGNTWEKLTQYVYKFEWGNLNFTDSQVPQQRIFWIQEDGNKQNQNRYGLHEKINFYYSDDFLATKKLLLSKGNVFYIDYNYLYVVELLEQNSQQVNLKVANPQKLDVKLRDVQLGENLQNHKFQILDTHEGQVFLNVNHLGTTSPMGTLYISDSQGARFSLSLQGHLRSKNGDTDFERLHGIYGIYIANVYEQKRREEFENIYAKQQNDDEENQGQDTKNKKSSTSIKQDKKAVKIKDMLTQKIQTMITFDKGGMWSRINAPTLDQDNKEIKCDDNCFLNIHSNSNDLYNSFYSSKNAIGLVLANGNVGKYLSHSPTQVNTYLSRDGGLTWTQIKRGAYVFEIGDHGSIIVMAKDKDYGTTKFVEYTLDEGITWNQVQISDTDIEIDNIITEPSNTGTAFMVLAKTLSTDKEQYGLAITIDFANQFDRNCSGAANPGDSYSDYEKWTPHSYKSSQCLLGQKVTYSRKKQESVCLNGEDYERQIELQACVCSEEDWECDVGYLRNGQNGPCVKDGTLSDDEYEGVAPEICTDYYQVSRGYRKIPFNTCQGGVNYSPETRRCPDNSIFSFNNLKNLILLIVAVVAIYYGVQERSQLSSLLIYLSSLIPLIYSHRKDYIDFSKAKSDYEEKENKFMNLFSFSNKKNVNHYSNINVSEDYEDSEDHQQLNKQNYNHLNQHNYFTDNQDEESHYD